MNIKCRICEKEYFGEFCLDIHLRNKHGITFEDYSRTKVPEGDEDYICCGLCDFRGGHLPYHLKTKHGITTEEYIMRFPEADLYSKYVIDSRTNHMKGITNPSYQHAGKMSPFSEKCIYETNPKELFEKAKETRKMNSNESTTIEYYLSFDIPEELAAKCLERRQGYTTRDKFIEKYGKEEGKRLYKIQENFFYGEYENIKADKDANELFWEIYHTAKPDILFATLFKGVYDDTRNWAYVTQLNNFLFLQLDCIELGTGKVIEFEKSQKRTDRLKRLGFKVLRISRKEFLGDRKGTLEKCLVFLGLSTK